MAGHSQTLRPGAGKSPPAITVVRCTAKLLKLLDGAPRTESAEPSPQDWYANLLPLDRRQCLLLVHAETLFAIFEPGVTKAELRTFGRFVLSLIEHELAAEGLPGDAFPPLAAADLMVGKTASRSILGTMVDVTNQILAAAHQAGGL